MFHTRPTMGRFSAVTPGPFGPANSTLEAAQSGCFCVCSPAEWTRGDETNVVEVEVSGQRLKQSIDKLAAVGATARILACADRAMVEKAAAIISGDPMLPSIEVKHVWSLLPGRPKPH